MRVYAGPTQHRTAADDDEVSFVAERTPAQRNAEGKRNAIDLDLLDSVSKRLKTPKTELQTSVAKARSVCQPSIDKRVKELLRPAFDEYAEDKIDDAELKRRKIKARQDAEKEHQPLTALDTAYAEYEKAVQARVRAEEAVEQAIADEDAAEAKVQAAAAALLPGAAGPVKAE